MKYVSRFLVFGLILAMALYGAVSCTFYAIHEQRQRFDEVYREGSQAEQQGVPVEACPYPSPSGALAAGGELRMNWLKGWAASRAMKKDSDK